MVSSTFLLKQDSNRDTGEKLRVYYAHAICLYDTKRERKEVRLIRERFKDAKIINPCDYQNNSSMDFYLRLVDTCQIVVFSCILGKITSGVGKEVNYALNKGKEVYLLYNEKRFFPMKFPVNYISRKCTIELYQKWYQQQKSKT